MWDTLCFIAPFPGYLYGGLYGFSAGVHWQDHVESKEFRDKLGKAWEDIVVEGPGTQSQS